MLQIFTIGYGSRSREEFLRLLSKHRIDLLVDIRRWPSSKNIDFKGEEMKCWLGEAGVGYIWMGEELGGYRRGGYRRYLSSDSFRKGIDQLLSLAKESRVCIMCLEVSPLGCHRRYISLNI